MSKTNSQKKKLQSKNPYTGQVREEFDYVTEEQLQKKIKQAQKGFEKQKSRTLQERAELIASMGKVFEQNKKLIAETITFEMGKPIAESTKQVEKTVSFCKHFSTNFEPLKPKKLQHTEAKVKAQVVYKPLGIVYLIVPYNFPLYLTFKGGITALLAGNCLLVKTTSSCPALGELIQKLARKAGFDNGEYQCLHASYDMLDKILAHKSVAGVSFTGSTAAGSKISSKAGQYLKKSVMELGGNDPFVVLKDADLQKSVQKAIISRTNNCGQVCFSPKRFIVQDALYDSFKQKLIEGLKKIRYGDPMDPQTQLGPLAKQKSVESLNKQLSELPKSYKIAWQRQDVKKPFFPITVVEGGDGKEIYDEEMFGPVFTLYKAKDQKHAIQLANQGEYGLGGEVFSKNHGEEVIDQIRCGMGFVNEFVKSDYTFPSGGVGKSGYGRECGEQGYKEFTNIKVHYIC